ncbi:hypothetical protein D6783_05260, partial [Candidatus Woesearchaeota archaeon]
MSRNTRLLRPALFFVILVLATHATLATTYYVRTDGNDSCNGLSNTPGTSGNCAFATVRHCYEIMKAGDTCHIGTGIFNDLPAAWSKTTTPTTLTGTLACTHGVTTITGTNTKFTSQVSPGDFIRCDADPTDTDVNYRVQKYVPWTRVSSIQSDTQLTLEEGYRGTTTTGSTGKTVQFYHIEGEGRDNTILTNYVRLTDVSYSDFHKFTGAPFDCDRSQPGIQDCTNVWTFCAPHAVVSNAVGTHPRSGTTSVAGHAGIQAPLRLDMVDDDDIAVGATLGRPKGLRPYSQWVDSRYLRSQYQPPATDEYVIAWTNTWPGTLAVVLDQDMPTGCPNPSDDRWYFHPREPITTASDVWIGSKEKRNSLFEGTYHLVQDLTLLAAQEHRGDKDADKHGFQLGTSSGAHFIFQRIRVLGNAWPYASSGIHHHIAVEDAIITMGPIGHIGDWMGFYKTQFLGGFPKSGETQPFGSGTSLASAPVFDSSRLFGGSAYPGDEPVYTAGSGTDCYDFDAGTHREQWDGCGTHGPIFHGEVNDPQNKYAFWINNILECGTGEIVTHPAENAGFVFIHNTVGRSCGFAGNTVTHWQYDRTATSTTNAANNVIQNNVYLWFAATNAARQFYRWEERDVYDTAKPDYNAYFTEPNQPVIHEYGNNIRKTLAQVQADGKEQHSVSRYNIDLRDYFIDPDWTDNPERGADYTPLAGNPAINLANPSWCPSYDYFGNPRNDGACDAGAVEYQGGGGPVCTDADKDGYGGGCALGPDCDDSNAGVNPGASEVCGNGVDEDCDGVAQECVCTDSDGDGYGVAGLNTDCALVGDDCDDNNASVHPGAPEVCGNGVDEDCTGADQQCTTPAETLYQFDFDNPDFIVTRQDWISILPTTHYAPGGYGWSETPRYSISGQITDAIYRDHHKHYNPLTFSVDVPNGAYELTFYLNNHHHAIDNMKIEAEGVVLFPDLTLGQNNPSTRTSQIDVADGTLDITFDDLGGTYNEWTINGLEITSLEAAPSCFDGVQNGGEEGVDCGGSCAPCSSSCVGGLGDLDCSTEVDVFDLTLVGSRFGCSAAAGL